MSSLEDDSQIKKAVDILNDKASIEAILTGVYENGNIKLALEKK